MNSWVLSSSPFLVSLFFIFFFFIKIPLSLCDEDMHESCSNMFNCGKLSNIGFPFWGDNRPNSCGYPGLKLNCQGSVATIKIMNVTYQVLGVNPEAQILKITRVDFSTGICSPEFVNSTLDPTLLDFGSGLQNLTIVYGCDFSLTPFAGLGLFNCQGNDFAHIKWGAYGPGECKVSVVVPVPVPVQSIPWTGIEIFDRPKLEEAIREGFDVKWKVDTEACLNCTVNKGVCGYDLKRNQSTCYHSSPGTYSTYVNNRFASSQFIISNGQHSTTTYVIHPISDDQIILFIFFILLISLNRLICNIDNFLGENFWGWV